MIQSYYSFIAGNRRFLSFGFLAAFFSSFGQTFFIGIFGPEIQAEFDLSHTRWGLIYMIGTVASAALLPVTGKYIDSIDLRRFALLVCLTGIFASAFISLSNGFVMLVLGIFFLRQFGQGLMSHMGMTSMARYFHDNRGRAIAIGSLGFAAGEACLPLLAVLLIATIGWRWTYASVAVVLVLVVLPLNFWLLRGHELRHRRYLDLQVLEAEKSKNTRSLSWTRRQMLRDPRFFMLIPGIVCPSMVGTGLFFHHLNIADSKLWSHAWITGSYSLYAVMVLVTSLLAGPLIDRLGAKLIIRFMLLPLLLAVYIVSSYQSPWIVWPYMFFLGIKTGLTHTGVSAIWAELYGTAWLGSIRSLAAALGVFSSALGPVIIGVLVDQGIPIGDAFLYFIPYGVICAVMLNLALSMSRPSPPATAQLASH